METTTEKAGWLTSEFWLAIVGVIAILWLVHDADLDSSWAAAAIGAVCFGYAGGRSIVKSSALSGTAQVADFKADLATLAATTPTTDVITAQVLPALEVIKDNVEPNQGTAGTTAPAKASRTTKKAAASPSPARPK